MPTYEKWLLLGNLLVTAYLTGLIWTIQVLHYPSFAKFGPAAFSDFHPFHTARITLIVALPMVLELALAAGLWLGAAIPEELLPPWLNAGLLGLVGLIWLSTFFWAIPLHNRLEQGFDLGIIQQLVAMNWIRTLAWTLRLGVLGMVVARLL
ncbi:MAG: hypothetical protein HC913_21935 [Microscillaceae bacterium]|nr:hypothetical protein [Microscillaceae bacterium]